MPMRTKPHKYSAPGRLRGHDRATAVVAALEDVTGLLKKTLKLHGEAKKASAGKTTPTSARCRSSAVISANRQTIDGDRFRRQPMFRKTMATGPQQLASSATARDGEQVTLECQHGVTLKPRDGDAGPHKPADHRLVRNFDEAAAGAVYAARRQQREDFQS